MIKKVVIAIDSFKGSVSSLQAGEMASKAIRDFAPDSDITVIQTADGGEGTTLALVNATRGSIINVNASGPLGDLTSAPIGLSDDKSTAYIDTASVAGLTLVPPDRLNPLKTSTYGLGQLIKQAVSIGCKKVIIGAGGSATVDGGVGMLQALGYRFLDDNGQPLDANGGTLLSIRSIDWSDALDLSDISFIVASDVTNKLCGPDGAARVFGPQKGATPQMVEQLDAGLLNLSQVAVSAALNDMTKIIGGGAAGGLGAALSTFLSAEIRSGIDIILDLVDFDSLSSSADLVLTGEGKIDSQTLSGKAPVGIGRRAKRAGAKRVVAICGAVDPSFDLKSTPFDAVFPILSHPCSLNEAIQPSITLQNIYRTVTSIISLA